MKIRPSIVAILVNAALAGAMHGAHADDAHALTHEILAMDSAAGSHGSNTVTNRIAGDFESFAGSQRNATALVTGLREGSEITLVQRGHRSATFTPQTGKMGYGNVSTSLALAQYQLAQQGIDNPTPLQLKAALNGGTIFVNHRPVTFDGVLQLRADGLGWGQIAQNLGTKLGPVVSGIKSQNAQIAAAPRAHATTTTTTTTGSVSTATQARSGGSQGAGKGIVNAGGGASAGAGKGKDDGGVSTASSRPPQAGRGVVTAGGQTVVSGPRGNAHGHTAGAVTAAGGGASSGAVTAAGAGAGNAGGGGQGHGKALGHSK